jgi:hypothetical protein
MDPVTFIGTLSATGAIVAGITKVAHKLSTLRGRFHEADTTLGLLIVELSAVKGALGQVDDWANFGSTNNPVSEDLAEAFELSLEGCRTAVSLLEEEVVTLTNAFLAEDDDFMARARTVWNESTIKDHQQKLHGQILALQLLLQTVQVYVGCRLPPQFHPNSAQSILARPSCTPQATNESSNHHANERRHLLPASYSTFVSSGC